MLTGFADEIGGMLARLIGYLCTPALIAMLGIHLWINCRTRNGNLPPKRRGARPRSAPAFAAGQFDLSYKTDAYQVLRHLEGGRKDVLRWMDLAGGPAAELEIYRPGGELSESVPAIADIAGRLDSTAARTFKAAGVIGSKFGAVTLPRLDGEADGARSRINFHKRIDHRPSCWFSCNF